VTVKLIASVGGKTATKTIGHAKIDLAGFIKAHDKEATVMLSKCIDRDSKLTFSVSSSNPHSTNDSESSFLRETLETEEGEVPIEDSDNEVKTRTPHSNDKS
jgi:hypothetical protein